MMDYTGIGIDISYWQHHPDFVAVKASGVERVLMRAADGEGGTIVDDSVYIANRTAARAVGLPVGSYFFNGNATSPTASAAHQWSIIDWRPGDWVAVDIEGAVGIEWSVGQALEWCHWMLDHGVPAINLFVYMSSSVDTSDWGPVWALGVQPWIAQYGLNDGTAHTPPSVPWAMWQHTSVGSVPGIVGNVDMNQITATLTAAALNSTPIAPTITPKEDEMITLAKATDGPANWGVIFGSTKIVFPGNSVGAAEVRGWTKLAAIQQGIDPTAVKVAALSGEEFAAVFS